MRCTMKLYFLLLPLLLMCWGVSSAQHIRFTIRGQDGGGKADTLDFGVEPLSTLCQDTALGEKNNEGPPPFPFMFTWTNPRIDDYCDLDGCFDCGRLRKRSYPLDLRPFISETQVDTYNISIYSIDGGFPFSLSWPDTFRNYCDSMKL